jgi:hypothetical protein
LWVLYTLVSKTSSISCRMLCTKSSSFAYWCKR